jgi:hypothetical protein
MNEKDKFDAVCKWCDCRRWGKEETVELTVNMVWVWEHADELRQEANSNNWPKEAIRTLEELVEEGRTHKSYQELEAKHGKKAMAFFKQIMALKANWVNCKLFGKSASFAKQFRHSRHLIGQSLRESVVLQLTRLLTDGKTVCGHRVLTIETLVEEVLDESPAKKNSFLDRIRVIKELPVVEKLKTQWRHNRLAHNNYDAALGVTTLPSITTDEMDDAIEKFIAVFQDLGKELGNSYVTSVEHLTIPDFAEEIARMGFDQYAQSNPWIRK